MTEEMYEIGKRLNLLSKQSVNYDLDLIKSLMCAIFCNKLLNAEYVLIPEHIATLLLIIQRLEQ